MKKIFLVLFLIFSRAALFASTGVTMYDSGGTKNLQMKAPNTVPSSYILVMPTALGSTGQCLQIAGISGNVATLQWSSCSGGPPPSQQKFLLGNGGFFLLGNGGKFLLGY